MLGTWVPVKTETKKKSFEIGLVFNYYRKHALVLTSYSGSTHYLPAGFFALERLLLEMNDIRSKNLPCKP